VAAPAAEPQGEPSVEIRPVPAAAAEPRREPRRDGRGEGRGERSRGPRRDRGERSDRPRQPRYEGTDEIPASIPTIEVASELEPAPERHATPSHEVSVERGGADQGEGRGGEDRSPRGRVFVSFGELDGADEGKVRELVASHAPGVELQAIELRRSHSFLLVPPDAVDTLVTALHGKQQGEKALTAERARRRRR